MRGSQVVRAVMNAWESHNVEELDSRFTEDCMFTGMLPEPMNKEEFIHLALATLKAMPDLALHASNFQEEGDRVRVQSAITGRQIRALHLPGMPIIPATGKKIALPVETHEYTVREDQISALAVSPVPGGGIAGLLAQLGVSMQALEMEEQPKEQTKQRRGKKGEKMESEEVERVPRKTRKRSASGETKAKMKSRGKSGEPTLV